MWGESCPGAKHCSFAAPEKSSSQNGNFHVMTYYKLPVKLHLLLLYHFFSFRFYVHIYNANFNELMVIKSYLQHAKSIEWSKFLQAKASALPISTLQWSLENPVSIIACFTIFSIAFPFQTL